MQAATQVNAAQASKTVMYGPTCLSMQGRLQLLRSTSNEGAAAAVPGYGRWHVCKGKVTATWEVLWRERGWSNGGLVIAGIGAAGRRMGP